MWRVFQDSRRQILFGNVIAAGVYYREVAASPAIVVRLMTATAVREAGIPFRIGRLEPRNCNRFGDFNAHPSFTRLAAIFIGGEPIM